MTSIVSVKKGNKHDCGTFMAQDILAELPITQHRASLARREVFVDKLSEGTLLATHEGTLLATHERDISSSEP